MRTPAPRAPGPRAPGSWAPAPRALVRWAVPVALLLGVSVLAGCGGSDASPSTTTVTIRPTVTATPSTPSSTTAARPTPPQTYDDAVKHLATGIPDAAAAKTFVSPTGNISCDIFAGSPIRGCELRTGRIAPPTADYCGGPGGGGAKDIGRVQFSAAGPVAVCNSDTIVKDGAPTLKYGSVATAGSIACISESIGVTCLDSATKEGFFLARDTFFIF